jgi:branched-chain amino acid transport system permease protein
VYVFARGRCIAQGPPGQIRNDPLVLDAYLGDDWRPSEVPAEVGRGLDAHA